MTHPRVMIIGSDGSSDQYGGELAKNLTKIMPDIALVGVGGPIMQAAGVRLLYDMSDLENLVGLETLKTTQITKRLMQRVCESMDSIQPDLVIQIGLPLSRLRILELAKNKGIPVIYYNTPLNWSTSELRVTRLANIIDQVVAVTKYEEKICHQHDIKVEFAGHPLVDIAHMPVDQKALQEELQIDSSRPVIVLIPGTREAEVKFILSVLLPAMKYVYDQLDTIQIVLGIPDSVGVEGYHTAMSKCGLEDIKITNKLHEILHIADLAIVTCNDVSIEAALVEVPAIAVHKVTSTAHFIDKVLTRKEHFAMVNFIMQTNVMPSLVRNDFSEQKVAEEVLRLLTDDQARQEAIDNYERVPAVFGTPGTTLRAAKMIQNVLETRQLES